MTRKRGRPRKEPVARPSEPDYYTIEEFCALFASTRKAWPTHKPYLKTIQFGPRTLIARTEVRRYVDSLERPAEKAGAPARLKHPEHAVSKARI